MGYGFKYEGSVQQTVESEVMAGSPTKVYLEALWKCPTNS